MSKHSMRCRQLRQPERVLQRFLDRFRVRFHHPEALIVGLLGVVAGQVKKPSLVPALRHQDVDSCGAGALARHLLGEQILQRFSVLKVHRHVNIPRNVRLADVELL